MKTLIAFDGSTTETGYAIYKVYDNKTFALKESGVLKPPKHTEPKSKNKTKKAKKESRTDNMAFRMSFFLDETFNLMEKTKGLNYVIAEDTFLGKDANAFKWLCRLQGFFMGYSKARGYEYATEYPSHWRSILGIPSRLGNKMLKREDLKPISFNYVHNILEMPQIKNENEVEAILIGRAFLLEKGYTDK